MKRYAAVLVILALIVIGLVGWATYSYLHEPKSTAITTSEALKERNTAVDLMNLHDATNKAIVDQYNTQITSLTNQKANLCNQVKTNRLTNPYCS